MSRTKKGKKAPGYEYWGRRGMDDKTTTKRRERRSEKQSKTGYISGIIKERQARKEAEELLRKIDE